MTDLASRLNALPADRRQAFLQALGASAPAPEPQLRRLSDPPDGRLPLSLQQEQLWVFETAYPGRTAYLVPLRLTLRGPLDVAVLHRALHRILARHPGLRTQIVDGPDGPAQRIHPEVALDLPVDDLSALAEPDRTRERDRIAAAGSARPLDLSRAPLLRARLLRAGPQDHELLLVLHHLIFDGWSNAVLVRDLRAAYRAELHGEPADSGPTLRYHDYARWQHEWIGSEAGRRAADHWRRTLAGSRPLLLPVDCPYPAGLTFDGATEHRYFAAGLMDRVGAFARSVGTTAFVPLLAAVQTVLFRTTGQRDPVIGSALSNRQRPGLRDVIGCLVNVVPLKADLTAEQTFRQLVATDRGVVMDALEHQEMPLERIIDAVAAARLPNRLPLVQATFTMQTVQDAPAEVDDGGLRIDSRSTPNTGARFEIAFEVGRDQQGRDYLNAEFNTALFDRETIRSLLSHVEVLLHSALDEPDRPLTELAMLPDEELRRVTQDWNPAPVPRPDRTIGASFDELAEAHGDRVAVLAADGTELTYAELRSRSDTVAAGLRSAGVRVEDPVGVLLDRSPESVVALLGVLKSGGCYVPVDAGFPAGRIAAQLASAGVRAVIAADTLRDRVPDGEWVVRSASAGTPAASAGAAEDPPAPDNLAYVLYTSGSSGGPKGVAVQHRSVVNFAATVRTMFRLGDGDRVLQFAPLTFDVSVFEIFGALLSGATLVLCTEDERHDPVRLADRIAGSAVTVIDLPPAVMTLLDPSRFTRLRIAFVGGEAFSGDLTTRWAATGCEFYNGYGPTETTVTVIAKRCVGSYDRSPPIGRAMDNHRAYVLDSAMRPVPIGVAGDLYVAGIGMARGYHARPGLTAAAFLPDPISEDPGGRLYRTGDVARWLRSGELEFLGRSDRQVQLHGLRIEVDEVAEVLTRHPAVNQAVVELQSEGANRYLAGFLCGRSETAIADVRRFAAAALPAHMIPTRLGWIPRIPLTASGKVDRDALPVLPPESSAPGAAPSARPPRPGTEERIAREVVAPILGADRIGAQDNLFAQGATSLQLMRVLARVRSVFGVQIPSADLYADPTIAAIAAMVDDAARTPAPPTFADLLASVGDLSEAEAEQRLETFDGC